jgi:hypothetical protein
MWNVKSIVHQVDLPVLGWAASYETRDSQESSNARRRKLLKAELPGGEKGGGRQTYLFALPLFLLLSSGVASAQYPRVDAVADRVVQKYQQSSCEQLWERRGQPRSQREQEAVQFLRDDPQMRAAFIDRIAAPIANKMFECGMIP